MGIPPLLTCIWYLTIAGQFGICCLVLARRHLKQWPSLFSFCLLVCVGSTFLRIFQSNYKAYFWLYWMREGLVYLVLVWALVDIVRSVPGYRLLPRATTLALIVLSATGAAFAWGATSSSQQSKGIVQYFVLADHSASVTWGAAISIVFMLLGVSGFGLFEQSMKVASGYVAHVLNTVVSFTIYRQFTDQGVRLCTNEMAGIVELLILLYWAHALSCPDRSRIYLASHAEKAGQS